MLSLLLIGPSTSYLYTPAHTVSLQKRKSHRAQRYALGEQGDVVGSWDDQKPNGQALKVREAIYLNSNATKTRPRDIGN